MIWRFGVYRGQRERCGGDTLVGREGGKHMTMSRLTELRGVERAAGGGRRRC